MSHRQFYQDSDQQFGRQDFDFENENEYENECYPDSNQFIGLFIIYYSNCFQIDQIEQNLSTQNKNYDSFGNRINEIDEQISTEELKRNQNNYKIRFATKELEPVEPVITKEVRKKKLIPKINKEIKQKTISQGLTTQGKNNAKNICRTLKSYIFTNFNVKQRQIEPLKKFLALKANDCSKHRLESFLKTKKGNAIGQVFFGNYQWARGFLETNKINTGNQVQYNDYWFSFVKQNQI